MIYLITMDNRVLDENNNSYFIFSSILFFWKFHSLGPRNSICILGAAILYLLLGCLVHPKN